MNHLPWTTQAQLYTAQGAVSRGWRGYAQGGMVIPASTVKASKTLGWIFGDDITEESKEKPPVPEHINKDMYGYRSWHTFDNGLFSLVQGIDKPWQPGKLKAQCNRLGSRYGTVEYGHEAPEDECHCGYFAYWTPGPEMGSVEDLASRMLGGGTISGNPLWQNLSLHNQLSVSGVVQASGNVIMHEFGFRAEYINILALSPMPHEDIDHCEPCEPWIWLLPELLLGLSKRYNVPTFETFDAMLREYPPTDDNEHKQPSRDWWAK